MWKVTENSYSIEIDFVSVLDLSFSFFGDFLILNKDIFIFDFLLSFLPLHLKDTNSVKSNSLIINYSCCCFNLSDLNNAVA